MMAEKNINGRYKQNLNKKYTHSNKQGVNEINVGADINDACKKLN